MMILTDFSAYCTAKLAFYFKIKFYDLI